jgi:hypothetical protein
LSGEPINFKSDREWVKQDQVETSRDLV